MSYFLVPHQPTASSIDLWAGFWAPSGIRPLLELAVFIERKEVARRALTGTWTALGRHQGRTGFRYRLESFAGLPANTRFRCALVDANHGTEVAAAQFDTLPLYLRSTFEAGDDLVSRPFTMMLGSCYWQGADGGQVARAYRQVFARSEYAPHVKMLVGDQVYIDQPPEAWGDPTIDPGRIREKVTDRYFDAWTKQRPLLHGGANICISDDHEYWNDYPFRPLRIWAGLQSASVRRRLQGDTVSFARELQQVRDATHFDIGTDLSVFVLDTRINRTETRFVRDRDLAAAEAWISGLTCPGVLVVGQPLLAERYGIVDVEAGSLWTALGAVAGGFAGGIPGALAALAGIEVGEEAIDVSVGEISDHNLAFYKAQYRRLTQAMAHARHDILVLSGDIHFGRIARTRIHKEDGSDPTRIYEVLASPMTMLDTGPVGTQDTRNPSIHPRHFPVDLSLTARDVAPGIIDYPRHVPAQTGQRTPDHFMTLSFTLGREEGSVEVAVRAWMPRGPSSGGLPQEAWTYRFVLDAGRLPAGGPTARRAVTHTMANAEGDILALCNPRESWSPRLRHEIIADIENGRAEYFVAGYPGQRPGANIHVVRDRTRGIAYLRTDPDQAGVNNLDNLPRLTPGEWH